MPCIWVFIEYSNSYGRLLSNAIMINQHGGTCGAIPNFVTIFVPLILGITSESKQSLCKQMTVARSTPHTTLPTLSKRGSKLHSIYLALLTCCDLPPIFSIAFATASYTQFSRINHICHHPSPRVSLRASWNLPPRDFTRPPRWPPPICRQCSKIICW